MAMDVGDQVGAVFVQANPKEFGLDFGVLEMDVAHFNGNTTGTVETNFSTTYCLPYCSVDFEVSRNIIVYHSMCIYKLNIPQLSTEFVTG